MNSFETFMFCACLVLSVASTACSEHSKRAGTKSLAPADMRSITNIDERFQSYNVEMVEVTGGRFWKPYKDIAELLKAQDKRNSESGSDVPAGMDTGLSTSNVRQSICPIPVYVNWLPPWAHRICG